jgi:predicted ATPase
MQQFVVISGCSGGGKSTLLAELSRRGHAIVEEPGRRIVAQELRSGGIALPWVDAVAFARRAVAMALADREAAGEPRGWMFFDRSLIDAAAALHYLTNEPVLETLGRAHRYHRRVFVTPPWPEIFVNDPERRHGFEEAVAEYDRLLLAFSFTGYEVLVVPQLNVGERANFVLNALAQH